MVYTALAGVFFLLAAGLVVLAGKTLFKGSWILGWLRGMGGILIAGTAVLMVLVALDFNSYRQLGKEDLVATLGFTELQPQRYKVSLVDTSGEEQFYELSGDLWQLDARIFKWSSALAGIGLSPGYRLDRLSGRYYSLEEEKAAPRTVYSLTGSGTLDIWQWLKDSGAFRSLLDATYGSATYLPMEDGALFAVSLTSSGLVARPLNDRAKAAIERWQ